MISVQEWLDKKYPKKRKVHTQVLDIKNKGLEGQLRLEGFSNLEKLDCSGNFLTNLDLNDLTNPEKLTKLDIDDNDFETQELSCFSRFVNLEELYLGTTKLEKVQQNIYNRFTGSLEPLKNLTKLKELGISNTDIDGGLEYLPNGLKKIYCFNY